MELTQEYLKERLLYNENTGVFKWKKVNAININIGDVAGRTLSNGYIQIGLRINKKDMRFYAHRLAWLYVYGEFPDNLIDHINHQRNDNRISNLRQVDNSTNKKNMPKRKNSSSIINGVRKQDNRWISTIGINNKNIYLGSFADKNEAICARLHANRLYKFHANHGK